MGYSMDKNSTWIQTYTLRAAPIGYLRAGDIHIDDIIHALGNICRFTGHTTGHYSVAQHSCLVAYNLPAHLRLAGLLHDAAEAYVGDVSQPVKLMLDHASGGRENNPFRALERNAEDAIAEHFGFDVALFSHPLVKEADMRALATEARDIMSNNVSEDGVGNEYHWTLGGVQPYEDHLETWDTWRSRVEFRGLYRTWAK